MRGWRVLVLLALFMTFGFVAAVAVAGPEDEEPSADEAGTTGTTEQSPPTEESPPPSEEESSAPGGEESSGEEESRGPEELFASPTEHERRIPDRYVVVYEDSVTDVEGETEEREQADPDGFERNHLYEHALKGFAAELNADQVARLGEDPEVDFITPDREVEASAAEPLAKGEPEPPTGVRRVGAATETSARQESEVGVAVLDTGVDLGHPELAASDGVNCVAPGQAAADDDGHGTHVAGTIAARNDGSGVVGVAPGTALHAVKVLDQDGRGTASQLICGIDWVAANAGERDIGVASLSLGGGGPEVEDCGTTTDAEHLAICNASEAGVTFVASAGNHDRAFDDDAAPDTPAAYPEVLTATAVSDADGKGGGSGSSPDCGTGDGERDDARASFSSFAGTPAGEAHTIAAPGVCVSSTWPRGHQVMSGTSVAAAHVVGIAAQCLGEGGRDGPCAGLEPDQVIATVREAAEERTRAQATHGFDGDPESPVGGRYYGHLGWVAGPGRPDGIGPEDPFDVMVRDDQRFGRDQLERVWRALGATAYPVDTDPSGRWTTTGASSWTSGFFPGALWHEYQAGADATPRSEAERRQAGIEGQKTNRTTHDVGFMFLGTFVNAHRLTGNDAHRQAALTAAGSLASRYSPTVGATRSWDSGGSTEFKVLIDNMMNLELLFWAARNGGNPAWRDMAASHALKTRDNHVRPDGGTFHMVTYDPATGAVKSRTTHQGASNASTWSRGQAWAIHGFAMAYRETGDDRFLDTARRTADYFLARLPQDKVPYWDFQAPGIPDEPRDSSAASVAASGLLELSMREKDSSRSDTYRRAAKDILTSLSTSAYLAKGTSNQALLLHGTRNKPEGRFDTGLIFGDYYFLEALLRLRLLTPTAPTLDVASARASAGDAAATIDDDPATRWSATGADQWIEYDLGSEQRVSKAALAFVEGARRTTRLELQTSPDALQWTTVLRTVSSGTSSGPETFDFPDTTARFVRVLDRGTSTGAPTSVSEAEVYGVEEVEPEDEDGSAPLVTSTTPANDATGVPLDADVTVAFSEAMDRPSAEAAFSLVKDGDPARVPGSFSWSGQTMTFDPNGDLAQGARYVAKVGREARDASGNRLAGNGHEHAYTNVDYADATTVRTGAGRTTSATVPPRLNADDDVFYEVNSTTSGTRTSAWEGSFRGVPSSLTGLQVSYRGRNSATCSQTVDLWDWTASGGAGTWRTLDTRSVGTTEVHVEKTGPAPLARFVGGASKQELRVRVRCTKSSNFYSRGDRLAIAYSRAPTALPPPTTPGAGPGPKLRWAPPALSSPETITLGTGRTSTTLDPAKDYIVKLPPERKVGATIINGGRNVVIVGGHVTIPRGPTSDLDLRALYVKGATGTVHIEGVLVDNSGGGDSDAIAINAPEAVVQIQNFRAVGLTGTAEGMHADVIQPWGGVRELRVDQLTGSSNYQGLEIARDLNPIERSIVQNANLFDTNVSNPKGGHLVWLTSGSSTCNIYPIELAEVYVVPRSGRSLGTAVWPRTDNQPAACPSRAVGSVVHWPRLPEVKGLVKQGPPAGGDFVPAGRAGLGYASPGYGGAAVPPAPPPAPTP